MLIKRIDVMISQQRNARSGCICIAFTGIGLICALCTVPAYTAKIKELKDARQVAVLRRDAAGPSTDLSLPADLESRLKKRSKGTRHGDTSGNSTMVYDSPVYYTNAAACGVMVGGGGTYAGEG